MDGPDPNAQYFWTQRTVAAQIGFGGREIRKCKANVRRNIRLVNGQLLSADGKTLLLMISIDYLFILDDEPFFSGLREAAEAEAANPPGRRDELSRHRKRSVLSYGHAITRE